MSGFGSHDRFWLEAAIELSRRCAPSKTAYAVGAIVVGGDGLALAEGYSRDVNSTNHAEESALDRLSDCGTDLLGATIYSSLEPCSARRSREHSCAHRILASGIRRVVFALREPPIFVDCRGAELLQEAGVEVLELSDLASVVASINRLSIPPAQ